MGEEIEIFILCRDRPYYSKLAINSVLNNSSKAKIIISDNSESDLIEKMCLEFFPDLSYRRRSNLDPISHLKVIVKEAKSEYLVMFHDDDIMKHNYLEVMLSTFKSNNEIIAIGSNAEIIDENGSVTGIFFKQKNNNKGIEITNKDNLLLPYVTLGKEFDKFAPFPSYIYKTKYISSEMFEINDGSNHADLSFLMKVLNKGKIYWTNETLIQYRIHKQNGSNSIPIIQKISLYNYLIRKEKINKKSNQMIDFRFRIWFPWLKFRLIKQITISRKERVVFIFLFTHLLKIILTRPLVIYYQFNRRVLKIN